jgi:hypothetical protein
MMHARERMPALDGHTNVTIVPTDEIDMSEGVHLPMRFICSNMAVASLLGMRSLISVVITGAYQPKRDDE